MFISSPINIKNSILRKFTRNEKLWPLKNPVNKYIFDDIMITCHFGPINVKNTNSKSYFTIILSYLCA